MTRPGGGTDGYGGNLQDVDQNGLATLVNRTHASAPCAVSSKGALVSECHLNLFEAIQDERRL